MLLSAFAREAARQCAATCRVPQLVRRTRIRTGITVFTYHEVLAETGVDAWTVVSAASFYDQLDYLRRHTSVLSIDEALEYVSRGTSRHPVTVLTFDDGYSGNATTALPIAESLGLPIAVFVSTRWIQTRKLYWYDRIITSVGSDTDFEWNLAFAGLGRYRWYAADGPDRRWIETQRLLTDLKELPAVTREAVVAQLVGRVRVPETLRPLDAAELEQLARSPLVTIGAHSHGHERLSQEEEVDARVSVATSKRLLETWLQRPVVHFAYPNGDVTPGVEAVVRDSGFASAFASRRDLWRRGDSAFCIPRIGVGRYDSLSTFKLKTAGILL
jgi:peptidoglycan/xylan/chitin deacetylase (PgdA/CDA1 family)